MNEQSILFEPHSIELLHPNSFLIGFMFLSDNRVCSIDICATNYNLIKAKDNPFSECATSWAIHAGDFVLLKDGSFIDIDEADELNMEYGFKTPEEAFGHYVGLKATGKIKKL